MRSGTCRIAFAAAPTLIVPHEPVSALDVSVQAAIVALLLDIQQEKRTILLFIGDDLALVCHVAYKVVVMDLGEMMETGMVDEVGTVCDRTEPSPVRGLSPSLEIGYPIGAGPLAWRRKPLASHTVRGARQT